MVKPNLPIGLRVFLPHDRVELVVVLVAEDEAHVVVVNLCVHEEGAFEVHAAKPVESHGQAGVRVHRLHNFCTL